jgi:hypothetical protein
MEYAETRNAYYIKPNIKLSPTEYAEWMESRKLHPDRIEGQWLKKIAFEKIREDIARATGKAGCLDSIQARELAESIGRR